LRADDSKLSLTAGTLAQSPSSRRIQWKAVGARSSQLPGAKRDACSLQATTFEEVERTLAVIQAEKN
jgi:hypothetical protein